MDDAVNEEEQVHGAVIEEEKNIVKYLVVSLGD